MKKDHLQLSDLPYCKLIKDWLVSRYGDSRGESIWEKTKEKYNEYLEDLPDYGGKKNGHAYAIYGGLLIFSLYPLLPDQPPITQLQEFVQNMFMGSFTKLGKVIDLNRSFDLWLIDKAFRKSGNRDRKDAILFPDGFINVDEPFDRNEHAVRYHFTQCPNAEFAKKYDLLYVLPLMCNCDFFGIEQLHGTLIRCGTCGNSDICDYCVVGNRNPLAKKYRIVTDEGGFLISSKEQ